MTEHLPAETINVLIIAMILLTGVIITISIILLKMFNKTYRFFGKKCKHDGDTWPNSKNELVCAECGDTIESNKKEIDD